MKTVSAAYKESMKGSLRERSFVRVGFSAIDVEAAKDGKWQSNGEQPYSEVDTLDYSFLYGSTVPTLELNRWVLNGIFSTDVTNDGYVSAEMSDGNGDYLINPTLTRTFSEPHTFEGMTLIFDTRENTYPVSIRVDFFLNNDLIDTRSVLPDNTTALIPTTAEEVDKVVITFLSAFPYRYARMEKALFGYERIFENTDIDINSGVVQVDDVDPISRRLPSEKLTFTLLDYEHKYDADNPTGEYKYIGANAPAFVQYGYKLPSGAIEWIKPDNYYLDGKPKVENNLATFSATGRIGRMTDLFYKSRLGQKSLYDMAEEVLIDANLTPTELGENPWDIDDSLKSMYSTAVLPITTHANCLQLIAHAGRCRLYSDDDNVIHLERFGVTVKGIYSGTWSDNGHESYSEWNTVDGGVQSDSSFVTLELNRWALDGGNQIIYSSEYSGKGYVGNELSSEYGTYNVNPTFTKTFDIPHDLPVLNIRFSESGDHPYEIEVKYYDGEMLIDTQTVSNISESEISVKSTAENVSRFTVTVFSTLPYRRSRVARVYYRETDFSMNFTTIDMGSQKITKIDQLKSVTVAKYSYSINGDRTTIYEGVTDLTEFHAEFSTLAQNVQISVSGGTLISSEIYGRAADMVLSDGEKSITITGVPLSESSMVSTYPVSRDGETDIEENPVITNDEMASALASHVTKYLTMRNTYDMTYRGNPELEVGDVIGLQTAFTREIDAMILVDEISFRGFLSGKVKLKGLI